jgi:peptidyl-prolyl cis-trans isomerase D
VRDRYITVSDSRVGEQILQDPAVAPLRKADGSIDVAAYKNLLASQGLTGEMHDARVRAALAAQSVMQGVNGSSLVAAAQSDAIINLRGERREVQISIVKQADLATTLTPTDADLDAYYKENSSRFQTPEAADIEYIVLDAKALQEQMVVNADDVKTYYEQNNTRFAVEERRRASHILIAAAKDAKADVKATAKAKAEALLAEVKKTPANFAELAKKNSEDPGSGERGGDLDFFTRAAMVKPFSDAAYALKQGEISGVVESDFGFHIIQLTGIEAGSVKPLDAVKAEIEGELKRQQATKRFAEVAEQFSNAVYEQADTFAPIAEKLKLTIQKQSGVSRRPARGVPPTTPLGNERFLQALFGDDSIKNKRNTTAIELGGNILVSGRLVGYKAAAVRPFTEVKGLMREGWIALEAQKRSKVEGEAKVKALQTKPDAVVFDAPQVVGRIPSGMFVPPAAEATFKVDPSKLPQVVGVDVNGLGYMIIKVLKVVPAEAVEPAQKTQQTQRLASQWASAESMLYMNALKTRYQAKPLKSEFEDKPLDKAKDAPANKASAAK